MPELGKAYVQIVPSAKGISGSISSVLGGEASEAGTSAGNSLGGSLVGALKGVIAAAGIGVMIKETLDAGGALQQSFGGLDTIYGDASEAAKKYAYAAQQAGISANDYAENAVSFGASLKQAFEGDTAKAVEAANTAILDMTDNAAKMGTPIESIQTAYQGFAKQNYTMLDNLKLGYGGTKEEMQRLLKDAQKISGVKYDMSNLGDVYEAIHVIQGDLGLTGVAAQEASETFSGSFGAMKAAAENLMANLALGEDIRPALESLGQSVNAFIFNNLLPMVGNIASALPDLVSGLGKMIIQGLNIAKNNAGEVAKLGIDILTSLAESIIQALPYLVDGVVSLVMAFGEALFNADWITIGTNLINALKEAIDIAAGEIFGSDTVTVESIISGIQSGLSSLLTIGLDIIQSIFDGVTQALPGLLSIGAEILTSVVNGVLESLPTLITSAGELVASFAQFITDNAPTLLSTGTDLIIRLANGILSSIPQLLSLGANVIKTFLDGITANLPGLLQSGVEIVLNIVNGILQNLPSMITTAIELITQFAQFIMQNMPVIIEAGAELLLSLVDGIVNNFPEIATAAINGILEFDKAILSMLPEVLQKGIEIIGQLVAGLIQAIPKIIAAIPQIIAGISDTIMEFDWLGLGVDILDGIAQGITSSTQNVINALWGSVKAAIDWVIDHLSIGSPSKYMADHVGKWMALGIGEGFEDNMPEVEMADAVLSTTSSMERAATNGIENLNSNTISYETIYEAVKAGAEAANLVIDLDGRELMRRLKGLGVAMA